MVYGVTWLIQASQKAWHLGYRHGASYRQGRSGFCLPVPSWGAEVYFNLVTLSIWDRVSCSLSWPWIPYISGDVLEFLIILPSSPSAGGTDLCYPPSFSFVCMCCSGEQWWGLIQGFTHARQAFYQLSYILNTQAFSGVWLNVAPSSVAQVSFGAHMLLWVRKWLSQLEDSSRKEVREVEAESLKTGGSTLSLSIGHNELVQEGTGWFDFAFFTAMQFWIWVAVEKFGGTVSITPSTDDVQVTCFLLPVSFPLPEQFAGLFRSFSFFVLCLHKIKDTIIVSKCKNYMTAFLDFWDHQSW